MGSATPSDDRPRPDAPRRPTGGALLRLAFHVGVPLVLIALGVAYFEFVDYVEKDPRFCSQCHREQPGYTLWVRSQHQGVVCQECHHETREEALRILLHYMSEGMGHARQGRTAHTSPVIADACARCHVSHDDRWPQIGYSIGHRVHVERERIDCLRCHGHAIHGVESAADLCIDCHEDQTVLRGSDIAGPMHEVHCLACHNFLTTDEDMAPSRARCLECHGSRDMLEAVFPADAPMGKLLCYACHRPHQPRGERLVDCASCHAAIAGAGLHGRIGHGAATPPDAALPPDATEEPDAQPPAAPHPDGARPVECARCHPAHGWRPRQSDCLDCHPDQVSHYRHRRCWSCHGFRVGDSPWDQPEGEVDATRPARPEPER